MAKIIKVGSQNPTFTSQKTRKASPIHTHRNSNEATNPFKFTNFEGNTLQFADVFEGFKPQSTSKLRMIASSVTGSMNKIKSSIPESIISFVNKIRSTAANVWDYAKNTNFSDIPGLKQTKEFLLAERHLPEIHVLPDMTALKEGIASHIEFLNRDALEVARDVKAGMSARLNGLVSNISFHGKQKYSNMSVAELEAHLIEALAEGGINE